MHPKPPENQRRRDALKRVFVAVVLVNTVLTVYPPAFFGQDFVTREPAIKAAYLFNFAKYAAPSDAVRRTIPNDANQITIGVFGSTPIAQQLQKLAIRKTVNGKSLRVRVFATHDQITPCHILFVPASAGPQIVGNIAAISRSLSCVLVTDTPLLANQSSILLITQDNRLRFEVNLTHVERNGHNISSRLLQIGTVVRRQQGAGQ